MEDLYVNVKFASKFLWKVIVLFMSYVEFSELEFKWSIHVIDALNQLHATHTWFPYCLQWFISIMTLRSVKKLAMLPQMWPGLRKSTMWAQITPSYIFGNIFSSERSIPFP